MKIEAEDGDYGIICVATIVDMKKEKLKIHYDGWTKKYDFWATVWSDKIHYCGWCQDKGIPLCPPKGKYT